MGSWIGLPIDDPLKIIRNYDIVWGSGRTAIEGAACGAAVLVVDGRGLAGMLKSSNYDHFRRFNFGLDLLVRPLTPDLIGGEIDAYNADDARKVASLAFEDARLDRQLKKLEIVFAEAIDLLARAKPTEDEINRALSSYLSNHLPRAVESEDSPRQNRFRWGAAISSLDERITAIAAQNNAEIRSLHERTATQLPALDARMCALESVLAPMISLAASVDRNRPLLSLLRPFARAVRYFAGRPKA